MPTPHSHFGELPGDRLEFLSHGDPDGKYWMPAMSDAPLRGENGRHEWFWEPGDEENLESLEDLMEMYYKSVGRNSTLIMGLTPDPDGLMPEPDVRRLKEWGDEIRRRFSSSIAHTSGSGKSITLKLPERQKINHVIIQEDIKFGESVRKYVVEARTGGSWKTVCEGESIGHKRIQYFDDVECTSIRLTIQESIAEPRIKNLAVYNVN
jgi:alpha-L-fucosidase